MSLLLPLLQGLHICNSLEPKPTWTKVIMEYPERFMLCSDLCSHFDQLGKTVARSNTLLNLLPDNMREMVASRNARQLYFP